MSSRKETFSKGWDRTAPERSCYAQARHWKELWHLPGYSACKHPAWLPAETHAAGNMQKTNLSVWFKSHYTLTYYSEIISY